MKKLLAMALCLVAVSGYAQKGKEKIAADFYGVDYSCVDVKGADEEPGAFIKAFEAINRLFLSEPKKYDVAGFTGIDILSTSVEQANESLGALAAEQFTLYNTVYTNIHTRIAEIGTHDELMASGGKYRELFKIQSKYYKEAEKDVME